MSIPQPVGQTSINSTSSYQQRATTAQQTSLVDQAVESIKGSLSTSITDWAVTHHDVQNIATVFAGLDGQQTVEVIDRLAQDNTLNEMASEMADGLTCGLGGLSSLERTVFFDGIASKLDGHSLNTLSDAFAQTDANSGGFDMVVELGEAVANNAPDNIKLDYVQEMAVKTTDNPQHSETLLITVTKMGDAEALAVGHVLNSLADNSTVVEQAFSVLSAEQLDAVMAASLDETIIYSVDATSASLNAELTGKLLNAAAQMDNADLKAQVFSAGTELLQYVDNNFGFPVMTVGRSPAAETIGDGLAKIIDSDTTGVVRELAYNSDTFDGTEFSTYAKQMLVSNKESVLGEQMARLQLGNDLTGDPIVRMETPVTLKSGSIRYENAGALGHFVAGVYAATESISADVKAQQDLVSSVLKSALTVVEASQYVGNVAGTVSLVGKYWVNYAINAAIKDPGSSAAEQLERAAMPIDSTTQEIGVGDSAISAFNDRISQVQRLAKP